MVMGISSWTADPPETGGDARLVVVTVRMQETHLGEHPGPAPSPGPEFREPLRAGRHHTLGEHHAPDVLPRHHRFQIRALQRFDHGKRPGRHRLPVATERFQIDAQAELVHLGIAHARADVATARAETLEPSLVQGLGPVGEKAVHSDVLDARGVPEKPRHRVDARIWGAPKLRLRELGEEAVDQAAVEIVVARQEERDGVHVVKLGGGLCPPSEAYPRTDCAGEAGARSGTVLLARAWEFLTAS